MSLVEHVKRELALVGNDDDFNQSIIKAVEAFASYGHSGGSAEVGAQILFDLVRFKNISALTNKSEEWNEVGEGMWQSSRNSEAFSTDGGETYYLLSETKPIHTSQDWEYLQKVLEGNGSSGG